MRRPPDHSNVVRIRPKSARHVRVAILALPLAILALSVIFALQRGAYEAVLAEFSRSGVAERSATAPPGTNLARSLPPLIIGSAITIIDGDGLVLSTGDEIRLGDFNAPEWNQKGGKEAKAALAEIAYAEDLACTPCEGARNPDRCTSYDRIIATCRLNGQRLGDLMRARGIAEGGR
jgi:endonuclease YncB( thermonuclease family)